MECLEEIIGYYNEPVYDVCETSYNNEFVEMWKKELDTIKQALIEAENNRIKLEKSEKIISRLIDKKSKKELACDIAVKKRVDIHLLRTCIDCFQDSLNAYNNEITKRHNNWNGYQIKPLSCYLLTEEEFDLLKESL